MSNFKKLSFEQLTKELDKHKYKQLHIHHTWKPAHSNFNGNNYNSMQQGMYNYHTKTRGWSDIAQHLSLFPDGVWLTGRPFNVMPVSIKYWNKGALAVEMIGNFDIKGNGSYNEYGYDKLEGRQKQEILKLISYFIDKYGPQSIKFHREGPGVTKTCPGTSLNKGKLIQEAMALKNKSKSTSNIPSEWATEDWKWAKRNNLLDGKRPHDYLTREELAVVLRRIIKKII